MKHSSKPLKASITVGISLFLLLALVSPAAAQVVAKITGTGGSSPPGFGSISVSAFLHADGTVHGHGRKDQRNGLVVAVIPPSPGRDYWCVVCKIVPPPSIQTGIDWLVFTILDVGDGKTSFDVIGIQVSGGPQPACLPGPAPVNTLRFGNFKGRISE